MQFKSNAYLKRRTNPWGRSKVERRRVVWVICLDTDDTIISDGYDTKQEAVTVARHLGVRLPGDKYYTGGKHV
jgi:hypothetical protein